MHLSFRLGMVCPCHPGKQERQILEIDKMRRRFKCQPVAMLDRLMGHATWHFYDEAYYVLGRVETNEHGEIAP